MKTIANNDNKTLPLPGISNLAFAEQLYENYLREPSSVPTDWQRYFADLGDGEHRFSKPRFGPSFQPFSVFNPPSAIRHPTVEHLAHPQIAALQDRIYLLIRLYRVRGHRL